MACGDVRLLTGVEKRIQAVDELILAINRAPLNQGPDYLALQLCAEERRVAAIALHGIPIKDPGAGRVEQTQVSLGADGEVSRVHADDRGRIRCDRRDCGLH